MEIPDIVKSELFPPLLHIFLFTYIYYLCVLFCDRERGGGGRGVAASLIPRKELQYCTPIPSCSPVWLGSARPSFGIRKIVRLFLFVCSFVVSCLSEAPLDRQQRAELLEAMLFREYPRHLLSDSLTAAS